MARGCHKQKLHGTNINSYGTNKNFMAQTKFHGTKKNFYGTNKNSTAQTKRLTAEAKTVTAEVMLLVELPEVDHTEEMIPM